MKKTATLLILTVAILAAITIKAPNETRPTKPQQTAPQTIEDSVLSITAEECRSDLNYLASDELEGRMSGKKGNILAAKFIKNRLERAGLRTKTQKFNIKRTNPGPKHEVGDDFTENVYAIIEGHEIPDEIVVMGAHFDHIGYGPKYSRGGRMEIHNGADDNASGTVAVLEAATALAGLKPKRTILFQFYSAEEMGLLGSRYYCENPMFPESSPDISKHVAMINLDMVGHLKTSEYKVSVPESAPDIGRNINQLMSKYGFAGAVTGRGTGGSDHASFHNKRIPVAFIHTGLHRHYHTPSDDVETLNVDGIAQIARYAAELIWMLANETNKPEFDESKFEEMPYAHDHGVGRF